VNCNRFCYCALRLALALGFFHISTGPVFAAKFVVMAVNSGRDTTSPYLFDPPVLTPGAKGFLIGLDTGSFGSLLPVAFQDLTFHGPGLVNFDGIDLSNSNLRYSPKVMTRDEALSQGLDDGDLRRYQRDDTYFFASTPNASWSYDVGPGLEGGEAGGTYLRATAYTNAVQPNRVIPAFYVVSTGDLTVSGFIAVQQDGFDVLGNPITHDDHGATARLDFASGTLLSATPPTLPGTLIACAEFGHLYNVDTSDGVFEYERPSHDRRMSGIAFSPDGDLYGISSPERNFPSRLYRIDPTTGNTTLIDETGITSTSNVPGEMDIRFDPLSGKLFCIEFGRNLVKIDPTTAQRTLVGEIETDEGNYSAIAFDRAGTLFMLDAVNLKMSVVDPLSGEVLSSIPISGLSGIEDALAGMDFDPMTNQLYIATRGPQGSISTGLFSFDLSTGVATSVGRGFNATGLAFVPAPVPEPSTITLAAMTLAFAWIGWRRRAR